MDKKLWFKRKKYGWGWTVASVEGGIVFLLFLLAVAGYPVLCKLGYFQFSQTRFLLVSFASAILLTVICYLKGEKPEWRWGDNDASGGQK